MTTKPCPDRARHALIGALMLGLACGHPALASTSTIGRTWPIAEPDAMAEIEARASRAPSLASRLGPRASWSALQAAPLGQSRVDRVRSFVPFYTVEQDIRLYHRPFDREAARRSDAWRRRLAQPDDPRLRPAGSPHCRGLRIGLQDPRTQRQ